MKYSLRSLFVVVTLVCVVLGSVMGRVEYLRRWAAFHESECKRLTTRMLGIGRGYQRGLDPKKDSVFDWYFYHQDMKDEYERAARYPLSFVHETKLPASDTP